MGPALLIRHPRHQFWPDGLSLLDQSGIDAWSGPGLRKLKAYRQQMNQQDRKSGSQGRHHIDPSRAGP